MPCLFVCYTAHIESMGFNIIFPCINITVLVWSLGIFFCQTSVLYGLLIFLVFLTKHAVTWNSEPQERRWTWSTTSCLVFFFRQGFHFWECQLGFIVPTIPYMFVDNCAGKLYNSSLAGFVDHNTVAGHANYTETESEVKRTTLRKLQNPTITERPFSLLSTSWCCIAV